MKTNSTLLGIATASALFFVSSVNAGAPCEPISCEPAACEPCETVACNPCYSDSSLSFARNALAPSRWKFSGFVEAGIWRNDHGAEIQYDNGTMVGGNCSPYTVFYPRQQTTDFTMTQLWLTLEREADTSRGFDWGFRTDFQYGTFAPTLQSYMSQTFDYGLLNCGDYGAAINQLYFTLGYRDLTVSLGHFFTPVGWESVLGNENFFYTNSLIYRMEPTTHVGAKAEYALTDRLSVLAGITNGYDNGFEFRYGDVGFIAGFSYELSDRSSLNYYISDGRINNPTAAFGNYWSQSLVWVWQQSDDVTESFQWDVSDNDFIGGGGGTAYGLCYTRVVQMGKRWSRGFRASWCRTNEWYGGPADEYEISLGLNWKPTKRLVIRPEIRYDTFQGNALAAAPRFNLNPATGEYRNNNQLSGGFSLV
ncbi:MAG: outer membrane beta-barrel protein [Thermoguttaceae bacterium]